MRIGEGVKAAVEAYAYLLKLKSRERADVEADAVEADAIEEKEC